jgi:hypothetical protein
MVTATGSLMQVTEEANALVYIDKKKKVRMCENKV